MWNLVRGIIVLTASTALVAATALASQEPGSDDSTDTATAAINDQYIVTLKPGIELHKHLISIKNLHGGNFDHNGIENTYDILDFQGYAGQFNASFIGQLAEHSEVSAVEPDRVWKVARLESFLTPNYGLGLISHRTTRNSDTYVYDPSIGRGTYAYVLDTGINVKHVDFEGRASLGTNLATLQGGSPDATGHGTHVAGIIGSKTFGVVKTCKLISVKVSNDGSAFASIVLKGVEWAVKDITKRKREPFSVIHLSMAGPASDALDHAVTMAFSQKIITVVAAGNDNRNTGVFSPNRAKAAIVVGATDQQRKRAPFSNYGSRVTLFAPGVNIPSTWIGGDNRVAQKVSGTSQAAAHVSGLILYFKKLNPRLTDPFALKRHLISTALDGVVTDPMTAPNKFAYNGSGR